MLIRFIILAVCIISVAGCGPLSTRPSDETDNARPVVKEHAPAAEIWTALAHEVEAKAIETPSDLARFVKVLNESGDLSQSDLAGFDAAFPRAPTDQRTLDSNDIKTLKGLK